MACEGTAIGWANAVTWGMVLVGWISVHRATLSRERRKEKREAVTRIIEEIKAVEDLAIRFHTSEKFDSQISDALIWRVNRVTRTLQRPPLQILDIPLGLMVRFRKGLTLLNTDASTFVTQTYHGEIIKGVRAIADELLETIEAARDRNFT